MCDLTGSGNGRDTYIIVHNGGFRPSHNMHTRGLPFLERNAKKAYPQHPMLQRAKQANHKAPEVSHLSICIFYYLIYSEVCILNIFEFKLSSFLI